MTNDTLPGCGRPLGGLPEACHIGQAGPGRILDPDYRWPPATGRFYPDRAGLAPMKRAWVRAEYAGELAVLLTWIGAFLPWSVSIARLEAGVTFVVVRFPFFMFQFLFGVELFGAERPFMTVLQAPGFPGTAVVSRAYLIWLAAAVVIGGALLASVAYYFEEERVESGPVDPVRALGTALLVAAVVLSASTWLLVREFVGTTVPVGVLGLYLFGVLLLTVERA